MPLSLLRWGWAQFRADAWVSVALAVLVATVAFTATAFPRLVATMASEQAAFQIASLSTTQRNLQAVAEVSVPPAVRLPGEPAPAEVDVTELSGVPARWSSAYTQVADIRDGQPEPLRGALGDGQLLLGREVDASRVETGTDIAIVAPTFTVDPLLHEHVRLLDGEWPQVPTPTELDSRGQAQPGQAEPIPVVMFADAAEQAGLSLGEEQLGAVLTGVIEPVDAEDARWEYVQGGSGFGLIADPDVGDTAVVSYFQNPASFPAGPVTATVQVDAWFSLDATAVPGDRLGDLWAQTRGAVSERYPIVVDENARPASAQFATGLDAALEDLLQQLAVAYAVLAVVVAGPAGVVLAVLTLGARLVVTRRSTGLGLAQARGASPTQLRTMGGVEGAVTGLLAAALGFLAAVLAVDGTTTVAQVGVAVLIGLLPGLLLALVTAPHALRGERADLGRRSGSRLRWVAEVVVVALAAAATWLLLTRGVQAASAGDAGATLQVPRVDPLVAATPVLLTAAACVLALRLFPVPVLAVQARLRRGRHLTGFLGAARAVRDSAAGLVPGLALVVGVSVAVFSTILVSTVLQGAQTAAYQEAGADLRVNGPTITDTEVETAREIDGVEQVVTLRSIPAGIPEGPFAEPVRVPGYAVEVEALREIQTDVPDATPLPASLATPGGGLLPAVASGSLTLDGPPGPGTYGTVPVQWLGAVPSLSGVPASGGYVVVDRDLAAQALGQEEPARTALIGVAPDADVDAVADAVQEQFPTAVLTSPADELERLQESPLVTSLVLAFVAAVAVSLALCVLAVVLTQLTAGRARGQLLAVLRTLGLDRRQARGLTAWEVLPLLLTSFVVGGVLGLLVPWLVVRTVDLTALTGGPAQPALAVGWWLLAAVVGVIVACVGLAVAVTSALASRADIARQLRIGDAR